MLAAMGIPEDFWWGTAASSTQAEGSAPASDWRRWEEQGRVPASGEGNGFATNYANDFSMYAEYGLTHHRLSLEWARLEPTEGKHDPAAIEHYTAMLQSARDHGIDIWACLHHFTLPGWFAGDMGGMPDDRTRRYYWARHVEFVGETFGDLVFGWQPVNEPGAYAFAGWAIGLIPPGLMDLGKFADALRGAHLANFEAEARLRSGGLPVATIMNVSPVYPGVRSRDPAEKDQADSVAALFDQVLITCWTRALREGILAIPGRADEEHPEHVEAFTHVGFSYYNAVTVFADLTIGPYPADARVGPMGYAPWSEGLGVTLRRLQDELPKRPLLIAECGTGTPADDPAQDEWRVEQLRGSFLELDRALDDGVDVRGFFHWTGVDNYEWDHGFDVQFGLFDRDRRPKPSAELARVWATRDR